MRPTIDFEGISVRLSRDLGESSSEPGVRYVLRWETLGAHHDRPRDPPLPPASALRLVRLVSSDTEPDTDTNTAEDEEPAAPASRGR